VTFELDVEEQDEIVQTFEALMPFWEENGFPFTLYKDTGRKERLVLQFSTNRSVDDFTRLLQEHPEAKTVFEYLGDRDTRITISVMECVI
jgi:hypothetical protein